MEKKAWGSTYYHGASKKNEKKILKQGLIPQKGKGAVHQLGEVAEDFGVKKKDNAFYQRVLKNTKGQVTMSRSKNLARIYGIAGDKKRRKRFLKAINPVEIRKIPPKPQVPSGIPSKFSKPRPNPTRRVVKPRSLRERISGGLHEFTSYQPLKIDGEGLKVRRDPDHFLLATQAPGVAKQRISRATPSGTRKKILKFMRKFK